MPARIRRLFFVGLLLAAAFLIGSLDEARASLTSRFMITRSEMLRAQELARDLRPLQEFSYTAGSKVIHCRMNALTQGAGFACEFHFGSKTLLLTSLEMERVDAKLATYAPGDRIFLRGRVQLECSVFRARELDWACRY